MHPLHTSDRAALAARSRRSFLASLSLAARPRRWPRRGRQAVSAAQESAAGRDRQEDRGHRVLLLRLPALRRARADPADLAQEDAGRRAVPARSGDVPGALGYRSRKIYYTLEALGEEARAVAGGLRRAPRQGAEPLAGQDVLRLGGEPRASTARRSRTCTTRSAIGGKVNRAKQLAQAYKHPVGADDRRRRQVRQQSVGSHAAMPPRSTR